MNIRSEKKILFAILVLGLLVRLGLIMFFDDDHRLFHDGDSAEYLALAENLRLGHGFTWDKSAPFQPNSFRTPIYPGFLFLVRFLFGSYQAILVIQSVLIVLSTYFLYLIGREYFSRKIALWNAGIFLFAPFSLNVSVKFLTQTLFLSLLILSIWSWVQFLKNQRNKYFLLTSILLPVLALTRPIAQYIVPVFILSLACSVYFKLSSITPYQLYFYDVPDAYALANDISYEEAGGILKAEIGSHSSVSNFQDYMKFAQGDILMSRSRYYFSAFPAYFLVSRVKNMAKFFLRDGIRYWYNDFSRSSRSD